jgi:2-phosphosulfolactate phosphatase
VQLDVHFGAAPPAPADLAGHVVVVVDVLRASTTIAAALAAGARGVVPCESVEEAVQRARAFDRHEVRLGGERRLRRIDGFDLGNSPREYTAESVGGRTVMLTTTNGTAALLGVAAAAEVFVAGLVNAAATVTAIRHVLRTPGLQGVLLVAAGQERRFALEDAVGAGRLVRGVARLRRGMVLGDGARAALALHARFAAQPDRLQREAAHAQALIAAGFGDDVIDCLAPDTVPVVARYHDRLVSPWVVPSTRRPSRRAPG